MLALRKRVLILIRRTDERRWITTKQFKQLVYSKYGNPLEVLNIVKNKVDKLTPNEVRVRWMGSPINPADINQIQGVYPVKPPLPATGGIEGFGEVEEIGSNVKNLRVGGWVVPSNSGVGCWRQWGNHVEKDLFEISNDLSFECAATFQVNPPTAYCMLKNFVNLKPGELVVQNGANSGVGRAVIQICKSWGVRTVNVVRNRDDIDSLVKELKAIGADEVFIEEEMKKESKDRAKNARLALNCVGGKSSLMLANCLEPKGVLITYGGMSKKPVEVLTGPFIFKDIKLVGFWVTKWYNESNEKKRLEMFKELTDLTKQGKLGPPKVEKVKLENWKTAMETAINLGPKQLLVLH